MADNNVTITLNLQAANFVNSFTNLKSQVETGLKETTGKFNQAFAGWRDKMASFSLAYSGVMNIYSDVSRIVGSFTKTAMEADTAEQGLAAAFARTGQATEANLGLLDATAARLQGLTTADDEVIKSGMAMFETMTGLSAQAMPEVAQAALGLSVKTGDVQSAFELMAKAANGHTEMFGKLGVQIDTSKSKEEQWQQVLQYGLDRFPQATAQTRTYAGSLAQMKNSLDEVKESIGAVFLDALAPFVKLIKTAAEKGAAFSTVIKVITGVVAGLVTAFIAWKVATFALTIAQAAFNLTLKANPIGAIISVIVGLITIIYTAVQSTIGWSKVWAYIKEYSVAAIKISWDYIKGFGSFLINFGAGMIKVLTLPYQIMWQTAKEVFGKIASIMKMLVTGDFKGVLAEVTSGVSNGVNTALESTRSSFSAAFASFSGLGEKAAAAWKQAGQNAAAAGKEAGSAVQNVASTTPAAAGETPGSGGTGASGGGESKAQPPSADEGYAPIKAYFEEVAAEEEEAAAAAEEARLQSQAAYYEDLKFADSTYYNYKSSLIKADLDAQLAAGQLSQTQYDTLLKFRLDALTTEKQAWQEAKDKPVNDLIDKYQELMKTMADAKTVGVQSWQEVQSSLTTLRDEMTAQAKDPQIAALIASLNEKISIAAMNAGKEAKSKGGWFWGALLGLNTEDDKKIIAAAQQSYQTITSGITDITNRMMELNRQKREKELTAIDELAAREKWSAEKTAAAKEEISKKYAAKERKLKETQRSLAIVQAVINTAEAVTKALTAGWILGPIFAAAIGAMGAVQIALIKAQKFAAGGLFRGRGGPREDANLALLSHGEYIINADATKRWLPILEAINTSTLPGSRTRNIASSGAALAPAFAEGGLHSGGADLRALLRQEIGNLNVVIDARSPDPKQWAKVVKLGNQQLQAVTL